ncbi:MAG: DNA repair protein RecO [Patescibacteria group bacterium]
MREKIRNIRGIVIRSRPFMENDLCVAVITELGEKLDLIVKGARGKNSRRKGHLEVLNLISATVYESRHNSYLQTVRCENPFFRLKDSYFSIFSICRLVEIINARVLEEDPHQEIYDLLLETMTLLNSETAHLFTVDFALVKLANLLGHLPSYKNCGSCHRVEDRMYLSENSNALNCSDCRHANDTPVELKYRKAMEFFRGAGLSALQKISLSEEESEFLQNIIEKLFEKRMKVATTFMNSVVSEPVIHR